MKKLRFRQRQGAGPADSDLRSARRSFLPVAILTLLVAMLATPTFASASLNFNSHGGPVQTSPAVFEIYWGNAWNSGTPATERSKLQSMYNDFNESSGSGWRGILTQYWAPQSPAHPKEGTAFKFVSSSTTIGTPYIDTTGPPAGITKANMEAEVKKGIEAQGGAGGWPETLAKANLNDQFVLFTPPGATWSGEVSKSACGEHLHSGESYVYARVAWEYEKEGFHLCSVTTTASHEFAESVTDPLYNAWKEWGPEEEVADRCAFNGRGEFPGAIEVAKLWDNHSEKLEKCQASDLSPPQIPPELLTEPATGVAGTQATLHGRVNPNGLEIQQGRFDWATTKEWETSETYSHHTSFASLFSNELSASISGLAPATTYHFQLEVEDKGGFPEHFQTGKDQQFTTLDGRPLATTEAATAINETTATLHGAVNPEGTATTYYFEYGETTSYGSKTAELSAGSGTSSLKESKEIIGLTSGTKYHFRIVATNVFGTTYGADHALITSGLYIQESQNPGKEKGSFFSGVSCLTVESCKASGYYKNPSSKLESMLQSWNGSSWIDESRESGLPLYGVSCATSSACMAVGREVSYQWTGTEWKQLSIVNISGATETRLEGVSCSSAAACIAVGFYSESGSTHVLAETWNGSTWSKLTPASPSGATSVGLENVSCSSATSCIAVGTYRNSSNVTVTLAEKWNGSEWQILTTKNPAGATESRLDGISCSASTACTGVGRYLLSGSNSPLVERWNGTEWTEQTAKRVNNNSTELYGVSCVSSTACTAVGTNAAPKLSHVPAAESWNGTEWTVLEVKNPSGEGTLASSLVDVSCVGTKLCTAVGWYHFEVGGVIEPSYTLAEQGL